MIGFLIPVAFVILLGKFLYDKVETKETFQKMSKNIEKMLDKLINMEENVKRVEEERAETLKAFEL